jgi:hypothetical protein
MGGRPDTEPGSIGEGQLIGQACQERCEFMLGI